MFVHILQMINPNCVDCQNENISENRISTPWYEKWMSSFSIYIKRNKFVADKFCSVYCTSAFRIINFINLIYEIFTVFLFNRYHNFSCLFSVLCSEIQCSEMFDFDSSKQIVIFLFKLFKGCFRIRMFSFGKLLWIIIQIFLVYEKRVERCKLWFIFVGHCNSQTVILMLKFDGFESEIQNFLN